ncbi:MAG: hypothetical protein KDD37_10520 [Bdellovibrionales bacterium]|nr:hypothetical protein [Bdellovibrionales bacterium]
MNKIVESIILLLVLSACQEAPVGEPFYSSTTSEPKILVSQILAGGESISLYDIDGNLISLVADFAILNFDPDGLAVVNDEEFYVTLDGTDQIRKMNLSGEVLQTITNTNFSGNLLKMAKLGEELFATEGNFIESFSTSGSRIGNPRIGTTIGGCVLSTPYAIITTPENYLITVGTGNDRINVYDVSDPGNTLCVDSDATLGNVNPTAILLHSNGDLYIATQTDDAIYRYSYSAGTIGAGALLYQPGTTILNNPTEMIELPDGSIIIASDGTNNIIQIDEDGNLLNSAFIQSTFTGQVGQMVIIGGSN